MNTKQIGDFIRQQCACWPSARENHRTLGTAERRELQWDGNRILVVHIPARAISSGAKVDAESISLRPCFLCPHNRPEEQIALEFDDFDVLLNPYPITAGHLVMASKVHRPQNIAGNIGNMLEFADKIEGYTILYNGPKCGASAPDHLHFQGVPSEELPLWTNLEATLRNTVVGFHSISEGMPPLIAGRYGSRQAAIRDIDQILSGLAKTSPEEEPMVNIAIRKDEAGIYLAAIAVRKAHRPKKFSFDISDTDSVFISPGALDVFGILVAPKKADFDKMSAMLANEIYTDVCAGRDEIACLIADAPKLTVGIAEGKDIQVRLNDTVPASFTVDGVTIGKDFHWQQKESQTFEGEAIVDILPDGRSAVMNKIDVESYLKSVISSEMNSHAPLEFLKAHAVISRSWVLAQLNPMPELSRYSCSEDERETIRWFDREAHTRFDVCADDHCQRYQGITRATTPQVREAVDSTLGEALTFGGRICDARFSKCCGGTTELFSTCWQPVDFPYLQPVHDEFCENPGKEVLATVLNNYDRATPHLYRWTVEYSAGELADIIRDRSGIDFGKIISLTPLHRGPSGRIDRLEIKGSKHCRTIGKELEIRRTLSRSHLYSSAFTVHVTAREADGMPGKWRLEGRGWGHGVGLCQIGAAVMGAKGYDYREILSHYFRGAEITRLY